MNDNRGCFSGVGMTILFILTVLSLYCSYKLYQQVASLSETVAMLVLSDSPATAPDTAPEQDQSVSAAPETSQKPVRTGRIKAAAPVSFRPDVKVRVEDHYPMSDPEFPDVTFPYGDQVVVDVVVNMLGMVVKASIGNGTTVSDEDILYDCKEEAMKIHFSYNPESAERIQGKVIYSYVTE